MIPKGRITPDILRKRALELQKLMGEFAEMTTRLQPAETLIGHTEHGVAYTAPDRARQEWYVAPTVPMPVQQAAVRASDFDVARSAIETINNRLQDMDRRITELAGVKEGEATLSPVDQVNQLQAVSRGMANAVRRIRALEEDVRLLREAQLATVQDVTALQESVRRLEQGNV